MGNLTLPRKPAPSVKRAYRIWLLFVVSLGIFAASYGWISWQHVETNAIRHGTQIADLGEKAVNSYFSQHAMLIGLSSEGLLDAHGRLDATVAQSRLSRLKSAHPDLAHANILSVDGVLLVSTIPGAKLPAPVVDTGSFNESVLELSKGKTFNIGRPVISTVTKEWIIPLRHAVGDSGRKLSYVLSATMPLSSPQSVWKDVALPEGMVLGVVRDDGYLMSRYPVPARLTLTDIYGKPRAGPFMDHLRDKQFPVSGYVEAPSTLDGLSYLFVFRRLSGYPLTFFVTQPLSNLRAVWWSDSQIPYLLMLLLFAGGYVVFRRAVRTQTAWEAERNDTEKTLREMNLELDTRIEQRTKELSESERFARASLDALSAHIAVLDSNGRIIATNLAWQEFAEKNGQLPDQVSEGADYLTVCRQAAGIGGEAAEVAATLIRDLIDGVCLEGSFEYPCHSPQEERWFVCRGTRFPGGGPVRLALAHENITARKRAEQLQSAEKSVLEIMSEGQPLARILETIVLTMEVLSPGTLCSILLLDTDGVHLRHGAAPSLPETYNRAIDGVAIGPSVGSCGTAAYRNEQVIVTDIATDPLWADYAVLALPLGLRACWSTPVRSGAGKVLGTFALYYREPRSPARADLDLIQRWTHLTGIAIERKHAEDEILALNASLEARVQERTLELNAVNQELEAFSYSVSHDLRSPLNTIDGFGQMLFKTNGQQLDDKGRHYLNRIRAGAQQMGALIEGLLSLAKISRDPLRLQEVDLSALSHQVVQECREREPEREVLITIDENLRVMGDPTLLLVVMQNLIGNAWKYTARQAHPSIDVGCEMTPGGESVYVVRDNGAGFDMAYADKLFGAFQRLHSPSEFSGTGIGLANVKRVIERHGGRIWAESRPNEGARFYFTLGCEL